MKELLNLAWKSLWNRRVTSLLALFSIALSVTLFLGVERLRNAAKGSFSNTLSQTDLIVGARASPLQLLLYAVFHMGDATQNIKVSSYEYYKEHPAVAWTIPISLGDSHRGYRVVATNEEFFKNYRHHLDRSLEMAQGQWGTEIFDVVLGADVARELGYALKHPLVLSHGITEGFYKHEDKPFQVAGILKRTGTALDRSLYITLEGMEAIHVGWETGAPPSESSVTPQLSKSDLQPKVITAFLLRTKNRIATLHLKSEIDAFSAEPLMGIIPGVALAKLWENLSYVESALQVVSALVVFVGFIGMLLTLYASLENRRREVAILRALGASPLKVLLLFFLESVFLVAGGIALGVLGLFVAFAVLGPWLETEFGLYLQMAILSPSEFMALGVIFVAGSLFGLVPAFRAYRNSLSDGLMLKI